MEPRMRRDVGGEIQEGRGVEGGGAGSDANDIIRLSEWSL